MSKQSGKVQAKLWQPPAVQTASKGFSTRPFPEIARKEEEKQASLDLLQMKSNQPGGMIDNINRSLASASPPAHLPILGQLGVQAKLTLGTVGDVYEQEADRVARQVVDEIHSSPFRASNTTSKGESLVNCGEAGRVQRQITVQASGDAGGEISSEWEAQLMRARGGGMPLSPTLREPMERSFGADFGGVRIHTGAEADSLARSIHAKAFTTGQDVFFRQGAYEPGSRGGQELIAHELTHVVQQKRSTIDRKYLPNKTLVRPALPDKIQRDPKYQNLKKTDDPDVIFHKKLGKELVATYRILSSATQAMKKGKNKEALKEAALGLAKAAISVATMLTGIPGLTEGTDIMSGNLVLNTGVDTLTQQVGKTGSGMTLGLLESKVVNPNLARGVQNTTVGGVIRGKIYDKVGTLKNAAITLINFIPFVGSVTSLAKAGAKGLKSYDTWNKQKGSLSRQVIELAEYMEDAIALVNIDDFGDTEIVTANKKLFVNKTRRTLTEVLGKYREKSEEFKKACASWSEKHEDMVNLLTPSIDDD